jgi:Ca2+-binding RTX toxin-like protein
VDFGFTPSAAELLGSISGQVFDDADADGEHDANEPLRAGVTVYLDLNGNGQLDLLPQPEPSTVTGTGASLGQYRFTDLAAGTYTVREVVSTGFRQTAPVGGSYMAELADGQSYVGPDIGNAAVVVNNGSISGVVFEDRDADGVLDQGEPLMGGVLVYIDSNGNAQFDGSEPSTPSGTGAELGQYRFTDLAAGPYTVREVVPDGFHQTAPGEQFDAVTLSAGQEYMSPAIGNAPDQVSAPNTDIRLTGFTSGGANALGQLLVGYEISGDDAAPFELAFFTSGAARLGMGAVPAGPRVPVTASADLAVGSHSVAIEGSAYAAFLADLGIPFLLVQADPDDAVAETDEGNNDLNFVGVFHVPADHSETGVLVLRGRDDTDALADDPADTVSITGGATLQLVTTLSPQPLDIPATQVSEVRMLGLGGNDRLDTAETVGVAIQFRGGSGDDSGTGGAANDSLFGSEGDDSLAGRAGHDQLHGDAGLDSLVGGAGNDLLRGGRGADHLDGGRSHDQLDGGAGNDTLDGGNGRDSLTGGSGDDRLDGGKAADQLQGSRGNDLLTGGAGSDTVRGGPDDDLLVGGDGRNVVEGGGGRDAVAGQTDARGTVAFEFNGRSLNFKIQDHLAGAPIPGLGVALSLDADTGSFGTLAIADPAGAYPLQMVLVRGTTATPAASTGPGAGASAPPQIAAATDQEPGLVTVVAKSLLDGIGETVVLDRLAKFSRNLASTGEFLRATVDSTTLGIKALSLLFGERNAPLVQEEYFRDKEQVVERINREFDEQVVDTFVTFIVDAALRAPTSVLDVLHFYLDLAKWGQDRFTVSRCSESEGVLRREVRAGFGTHVSYTCAFQFSGTPPFADFAATGLDAAGNPLPRGSTVELVSRTEYGLAGAVALDTGGQAVIPVPLGRYRVSYNSPGYRPASQDVDVAAGGTSRQVRLEPIEPPGPVTELTIPATQSALHACYDPATGESFVDAQSLSAVGGSVLSGYTWTLANLSTFPPGTTVDPLTGIFHGNGGSVVPGDYQFSMTVTDGSRGATGGFRLHVDQAEPGIGCSGPVFQSVFRQQVLSDATAGEPYAATLFVAGGVPPYSWSLLSGSLPPGLQIDRARGVLRGTPFTSARGETYSFSVTIQDSTGATAVHPAHSFGTSDYRIHVRAAEPVRGSITVSPASGLVTTEQGGVAAFTVVLDSPPAAPVTIALSSTDAQEGIPTPASLTFTRENWNSAQTVTVRGVDDALADGDIAYRIVTAPATSTDLQYDGVDAADVSLTNADNEVSSVRAFDGSYSGSYSGTASGFGVVVPVSGGVAFTVSNGVITVTAPGPGSGTVAPSGEARFGAAGGSVGNCTFTGSIVVSAGVASAQGGWSCSGGAASGQWSATRPSPLGARTPSTPVHQPQWHSDDALDAVIAERLRQPWFELPETAVERNTEW